MPPPCDQRDLVPATDRPPPAGAAVPLRQVKDGSRPPSKVVGGRHGGEDPAGRPGRRRCRRPDRLEHGQRRFHGLSGSSARGWRLHSGPLGPRRFPVGEGDRRVIAPTRHWDAREAGSPAGSTSPGRAGAARSRLSPRPASGGRTADDSRTGGDPRAPAGWWTTAHPADHVGGDKAYSSRRNRRHLPRRQIKHTIPEPRDQRANRQRRGSKGGRPTGFGKTIYRRRNEVERAINRLKTFRAIATRYDKRAYVLHGTVTVGAIRLWLRPG